MKTTIVLITLTLMSCSSRYNSQKYLNEEDKAISDLLPEMVNMDYMLEHNEYGSNPPTLYLIGELSNRLLTFDGQEIVEVDIVDGTPIGSYVHDGISDEDKKQLKLLINNAIPKRELSGSLFKNIDKLNIKVFTVAEMKVMGSDTLLLKKIDKEKAFGCLEISRIIFSNNYQKGFVSFGFFCGEACAWNSVIEIEKINGRWIKKREISGGIALYQIKYQETLPTTGRLSLAI